MSGEYLRVTPAELDRALKDPEWALDLAEEIQDAQEESEPAPAEARHFHSLAAGYACGHHARPWSSGSGARREPSRGPSVKRVGVTRRCGSLEPSAREWSGSCAQRDEPGHLLPPHPSARGQLQADVLARPVLRRGEQVRGAEDE
ncbi:DUF1877 family protein [Streptomyces sp. NPDC058424]|uniref:DUF1877 family protein n=1 Tax=Streptomyces sp. NPDC058424 TaxID=3346491 RepID=UPI003647113D